MSSKDGHDGSVSITEEVKKILPALRANSLASEERRWLTDETIDLLDSAGVFKIAVPARFGGLDFDAGHQARILSEIARACPAAAWVSFVWATSAWTATLYPEQTQREVFADGGARISSAFAPTGHLVATEGGWRLNGRWRFNSGCRGAQWNFVAAVLEHPDGSHEEIMALVPMADLVVVDDWHVSSGSGTGSATTVAENVFVPADRAVTFEQAMTAGEVDPAQGTPTGRNYSLLSYVMIEAAAVFIGIARGAYDLFVERLPGRGITYTAWEDQRQHPVTQIQVATAYNKITAAEELAKGWAATIQARADAGQEPTVEEKAVIRGQVGFVVQLAREVVESLYSASGGSVIHRDVPLQRYHRDIQGFSLHALAQPIVNLELQGRVLLGLEPDTPFL
jgi:3-hydroxy-9,10-secoandrosta-1,3,5(10)-triene-9,17-dione monooxygenase